MTGAYAAAGIVIAVVSLTGLGVKIGNFVIYFSGNHLSAGIAAPAVRTVPQEPWT